MPDKPRDVFGQVDPDYGGIPVKRAAGPDADWSVDDSGRRTMMGGTSDGLRIGAQYYDPSRPSAQEAWSRGLRTREESVRMAGGGFGITPHWKREQEYQARQSAFEVDRTRQSNPIYQLNKQLFETQQIAAQIQQAQAEARLAEQWDNISLQEKSMFPSDVRSRIQMLNAKLKQAQLTPRQEAFSRQA